MVVKWNLKLVGIFVLYFSEYFRLIMLLFDGVYFRWMDKWDFSNKLVNFEYLNVDILLKYWYKIIFYLIWIIYVW